MRGVPIPAYQESVIDISAVFHANWWDHLRLTLGEFEVGYWSRDNERFQQYLERRTEPWRWIVGKYGDQLPQKIQAFYIWLFERFPDFFAATLAPRFTNRSNLALIHGDTYFYIVKCLRNLLSSQEQNQ